MVVRIALTDVLIKTLTSIEKLPAGVNAWFEVGLHTNNTLKYVNVKKLHQAIGNSLCVALPGFSVIQKGTSGKLTEAA